jgi:BirA family biotin operon repressor/biotin-[acetyl-CoA-carboxylase] ligase
MECLFEEVNETLSTNQDLMNRWRSNDLLLPVSRLANHQTAGRGRRGNAWISEKNNSLTFSLAYYFDAKTSLRTLQPLSLVVGLAILKSIAHYWNTNLENLKSLGLGLKWPNDLYLGNAKLGGVLIESGQKTGFDPIWTIIGIGLNLNDLKTPVDSTYLVSSLDQVSIPNKKVIDRLTLWKVITQHLIQELQDFTNRGFIFEAINWNDFHIYHERDVVVTENEKIIQSGKIIGVDTHGALLLETPIGIQTVHNGNISIRNSLG